MPLPRLGVGLGAVAEVMERLADDAMADAEAASGQGLGRSAGALAGPPQRRHGIAPRLGGDQLLQGGEDRRALVTDLLAATAGSADMTGGRRRCIESLRGPRDSPAGDPRGPAHAADAAIAERAGRGGGEEPPPPLIEARQDRGELLARFWIVVHRAIMCDGEKMEQLFRSKSLMETSPTS